KMWSRIAYSPSRLQTKDLIEANLRMFRLRCHNPTCWTAARFLRRIRRAVTSAAPSKPRPASLATAALSGALLCLAPLALRADDQANPSQRAEKSEQESRNTPPQDHASGITSPTITLSAPKIFPIVPLDLPAVFRKPTPESLDDLRAIERQVQAILPRLSRAVVAVEIGGV